MVDFNLTLKQFENISNGEFNAGLVDVQSAGKNKFKLTKLNHHVTFQSLNYKTLTPEKIVKIKESFINALEKEHLSPESIANIKKDLGLDISMTNSMAENREMINRRFAPLTRQQIKDYIALAKGQAPEENRNLQVQQNVLNGLTKDTKIRAKALLALSYLSGVRFSEMQNLQTDDLKFFAKQPKILNQVYKNVKRLTEAFANDPEKHNLSLSSYLFSKGNHEDVFTLKIVKGENNQSFITGSVTVGKDTIPLNFMVPPQEYLDTINQRLVDFMDVLPDVKAENGVSLGRTYLQQNLENLKSELSMEQLSGTQPNHLRSLCLAIIRKDNDEISPDVERLSTNTLLMLANDHIKYNYSNEELKSLVDGAVRAMELLAKNLVPGQLIQAPEPQNVQNPEQLNADNDVQDIVENNEPEAFQEEEIPAIEYYDAPVYEDSKNITSYSNQLFDTISQSLLSEEQQNVDINALKTLLVNNTDVMLSFITSNTELGNYEEEINGNKSVISPKFKEQQLFDLFFQILDDYKAATGKEFNRNRPTKAEVDDLKLFLQNTATLQNLDKSIKKALTFVTTQYIRGQLPANEAEQAKAPAIPFPDLTFNGYARNTTVNNFLKGLAKLSRGNDLNPIKEFIWKNPKAFLTFISGQFDDDEKIDSIYREQFKKIGSDLRATLKNLTGIEAFGNKPDFSNFTDFEFDKLLVRLNDDHFIREVKTACESVPLSLTSLNELMKSEIDNINNSVSKEKTSKEEPVKSYIEPMYEGGARKLKSKDELIGREDGKFANTVLPKAGDIIPSPGAKWVRDAMKNEPDRLVTEIKIQAMPMDNFVKAEDSAIRKVAGFFLSIKHAGDEKFHRQKLYQFIDENFDAIAIAVSDKNRLKQCLLPKLQPMADEVYSLIKDTFKAMTEVMVEDKKLTKNFDVTNLSYGEFDQIKRYYTSNAYSFRKSDKQELLGKITDAIDKNLANSTLLDKASQTFQSFINEVFKLDADFKIEDEYSKMSAQQIKDNLSKKSVDEILKEASLDKNKSAKVAFNLMVLKNYFLKIPKTEIAQILDDSLQTEPNDNNRGDLAIAENKRLLSAIFKGSGPLLQKMLQGMNKELADKTYGDVFDELKSNLKHIDESYISETIKKYKKSDRRTAVSVEVGEPLGSATIAETYKCTIRIERFTDRGRTRSENELVVKVMRPNVKQRAENEAKIFSDVAEQIPGMKEAWKVQEDSIMKEFDLVNEANNIDKCHDLFEVMNNFKSQDRAVAPNVHSLKRDTSLPVQNDMVVTNEIEGDTVDKVYSDLENQINTDFRKIFKVNSQTGGWELDKNGKPLIREDVDITDIILARRDVAHNLKKIFKYNGLINQATAKWLKEAIFNTGTIHNDIHGGNLMISQKDDSITFIDFGNVLQISKETQSQFKDLLVFTMNRDTKKFMDTLLPMLPKQPTEEQKEKMNAIVDVIMQKGHSTKDAGYRFTAIIAEFRKLGLIFPGEIDGICNGLNRLQSFAENTAKLLKQTQALYELVIGNSELSPYKQTEEEQKFSFEGNMFNKIIDQCFTKEVPDDRVLDPYIVAVKDPKSEFRKELSQKILTDAFDGNLVYSEKFIANYLNKGYVSGDELNSMNYQNSFDSFKQKMAEAKAKGITRQQLLDIIDMVNDPKKVLPKELDVHKDFIKEFTSSYKNFENVVVFALRSRLSKASSWCNECKRYERIEPSVDEKGKILNNPFESNSISVEGVLGNMITEVNNFTMTKVSQPIGGEVANSSAPGQKPLVEVSDNPLGHAAVQEKIAG